MFDIGFSELLVIGVVALIVLGPERLPKAARFAGLWVRRARAQWASVKGELERELASDELKRSLHDTEAAMRDIDASVRAADADARREFDAIHGAAKASEAIDGERAAPIATNPDNQEHAPEPALDAHADATPVPDHMNEDDARRT